MKKRIFVSLLSLCLIVGLLPMSVLAAEAKAPDNETPVVCTMNESCEAQSHNNDCPLYMYTVTGDIPSNDIEEQPTELTAALPDPSDIEPLDKEQMETITDNSQTISTDTTWDAETTLSKNLIVESGATLTIGAKVTISGNVVISGGGTIKRGTNYTTEIISVPAGAELTLENITVDGNEDVFSTDAAIVVAGKLFLNAGAIIQKNNNISTSSDTRGGGIRSVSESEIKIDGAVIQNNSADSSNGGGLTVYGTLNFLSGTIKSNNAKYAGAIYIGGTGNVVLEKDSKIEENYSTTNAAAISAYTGAILTVNGAYIAKNESKGPGGAIFASSDTTIQINDCIIQENIAENGSAFYGSGTITFTSGVVSKNKTIGKSENDTNTCAAIWIPANGKFIMQGGSIINNTTERENGCGIYVIQNNGTFELSGNVTISGNEKDPSGSPCDIYLDCAPKDPDHSAKIIVSGPLNTSTPINVFAKVGTDETFSENDTYEVVIGTEDYTLDSSCMNNFSPAHNDRAFYFFNNTINLASAVTVTFNANTGDDSAIVTQKVPSGHQTNLNANTFVRDGYIFNGWSTQPNGGKITYKDQAEITTNRDTTLYAQWIELTTNDISMEYNATQAVPNIEGVTLNWTSDNEHIVTIEKDQIKAVSVGTATITAQATTPNGGSATLTVDVEVTPMPITFGNGTGENPSGTVDHVYDGMAPDYFDYAAFYPATVEDGKVSIILGSQEVALDAGNDIVFVYDDGSGSGAQDHDSLPVNVTDSEGMNVTVKLLNPNYRFVTDTNTALSETVSVTVKIHADNMDKQDLYINGEKVDVITDAFVKTYNGQGQAPVSDLTTVRSEGIDTFTVHFHPLNSNTDFEETHLTGAASDLTAEAVLEKAPKEPGQYLMIVNGLKEGTGTERGRYAYASAVFSIEKSTVTIRPNDKTIYVGDALPELGADDYTVTGLAPGDSLTALPTLAYDGTPDTTKEGSYAIKASGAAVDEEHYTLKYEDGVLRISLSSGNTEPDDPGNSGNTGDSGNTDKTDKTDKTDSLTTSPQTGDMGNITVWTALSALSVIAASAVFLRKRYIK